MIQSMISQSFAYSYIIGIYVTYKVRNCIFRNLCSDFCTHCITLLYKVTRFYDFRLSEDIILEQTESEQNTYNQVNQF